MFIHLKGIMVIFYQSHFHLMENTWRVDLLISNFKFLIDLKSTEHKKEVLKINDKVPLKPIY